MQRDHAAVGLFFFFYFFLVTLNVKRHVRWTLSKPTSAVTEGLRHYVSLMTTGIQTELTLVVIRLSVTSAYRHWRNIRRTGWRTDAMWTTELGTLTARITFQVVAARWYWRTRVRWKQKALVLLHFNGMRDTMSIGCIVVHYKLQVPLQDDVNHNITSVTV